MIIIFGGRMVLFGDFEMTEGTARFFATMQQINEDNRKT